MLLFFNFFFWAEARKLIVSHSSELINWYSIALDLALVWEFICWNITFKALLLNCKILPPQK